tara:strand:- start:3055 stop:3849 length:795 start_codon:yes stop_codon:yes gene_type:complete
MDYTDRMEFAQEQKLRQIIRKGISTVKNRQKQKIYESKKQELQLRYVIRELIKETALDDNDPAPHNSTGINVLSDLLKKILPIVEIDFKKLTSDKGQRESFRAHILKAIEKTLAPSKALDHAGEGMADLSEQENIELDIASPEEQPGFIDIDGDGKDEPEEEQDPRAEFGQGLEGSEETGRNVAFDTFKKIGTNIVDAYDVLGSDDDKDLFYDYLITNMKLYFDKFESDLSSVEEPTTDEYEQQVNQGSSKDYLGGASGAGFFK